MNMNGQEIKDGDEVAVPPLHATKAGYLPTYTTANEVFRIRSVSCIIYALLVIMDIQ